MRRLKSSTAIRGRYTALSVANLLVILGDLEGCGALVRDLKAALSAMREPLDGLGLAMVIGVLLPWDRPDVTSISYLVSELN